MNVPWKFKEERLKKLGSYPLGETDQYKDQLKDILNSILTEELSD